MSIRCKMKLQNVFHSEWGSVKALFSCEYDPNLIEEEKSFQKATPSGNADFLIDNPRAAEQLVIGRSYYFDITPVPKD